MKCENCGIEFTSKRKARFCSVSCNKKMYWKLNTETLKEKGKKYFESHKEKYNQDKDYVKRKNKEWNESNKEYKAMVDKHRLKEIQSDEDKHLEFKKQRMEYYHSIKDNPVYKMKKKIRGIITSSFRRRKVYKNNSSENILGCTIEEFRAYIESLFIDGMSWENYGTKTWHVDHIIPLSTANTSDEVLKLCHYTNLQPLWAIDNHKKSNKLGELNEPTYQTT